MARIRTIKPDFWEDEGIGLLSMPARLLFIATWNLADDQGLLRWTADYIKAQVFPYDTAMTATKVAKVMAELVPTFIFPYKAGPSQQSLAQIIKFHKHQRINRPQPGKFPPPDVNDSLNDSPTDSLNDSVTGSLPEGKGREIEGNGNEEGKGNRLNQPPPLKLVYAPISEEEEE